MEFVYQRVFIGPSALLIKFKVQVQNLVLTVISLCDLKLDLIMFEPHYVNLIFYEPDWLSSLNFWHVRHATSPEIRHS